MLIENLYVYNPGNCQQHYGNRCFAPAMFTTVPVQEAEAMRSAQLPLLIEGDADFPQVWAVSIPQRQGK